jgi:hypothetical protein
MDTHDFLQRVLPTEGTVVSIVINPGDRPRQKFYNTIQELADASVKLSNHGHNVYYAVASFNDATARKQSNVNKLKALYLDIDCGPEKPFASPVDGARALSKFLSQTGLPKPLTVLSGNGLHVYWVLTSELPKSEWQPLANALKLATEKLGFEVDPAVPADSARVLRAVGTVNPKGGKTVRVLVDAPDYDVATIRQSLLAYTNAPPALLHRPPSTALLDAMAGKQEFAPSNPVAIETNCPQIAWAATHQDQVSEPLWYLMLGVAAHCQDPEETAINWSRQHPDFSEDRTLQKLQQWRKSTTGPATCERFESNRPDGCKACPFKGKIATPALLGTKYKETGLSEDAPDQTAKEIPLPRGFIRANGGICNEMDGTHIAVCEFDLYPVGYGRDETLGYETVRYKWKRMHVGWQDLSFRQALLAAGSRDFATVIADQGIVFYSRKQTESFQFMLRAYMDELRKIKSMTNLYQSMGWKENNTQFVLGANIFTRGEDGSVTQENIAVAQAAIRTVADMYTQAGTVEDFTHFSSIIEKAKLWVQGWALMVSMSAPLYQFTGIKGITINLYGPTGSGKTLAQLLMQSVWGNPDQLHYASKFTQNALYSRMGLYNNLPMTIDETTTLPAREVGDFLYDVSQGKEKARLTRTTEERTSKTWRLPCVTSSNKSMSTMLVASGLESDAQMMRLLEITVNQHPLFTKSTEAGKRIHDFAMTHYGMVGPAIITKLLEFGPDYLRLLISEHRERFLKEYNCKFSGSERFWEQCLILADLMGKLATEWGLIQFDYKSCTNAILKQMGAVRQSVKDNTVDTFDLICEYINEHAKMAVTMMHTAGSKGVQDMSHMPNGEVRVRFELFRKDHSKPFDKGAMLLDRAHFKRWLANKGADFRSVMRDIELAGIDATPTSKKACLGKGTSIKLGQQYVVGINLTHDRLESILTDLDSAITEAQLSGLTVIEGGLS